MSALEFRSVTKHFGPVTALRGLDLTVASGEFFVILGPTGAGKTTLLRCVAGLETPQGQVVIGGEDVGALPPAERDVAFIFQQYSLYPHYSVAENIAFPLRSDVRRVPEAERKKIVQEAAELLNIGHLLERRADKLSGGEMQRVAIGRAIVRRPKAYLMDEPLSSLDAKLREKLRTELKVLQRRFGITTLYVTHDQAEAMSMADRIGVLRGGVLEQVGTPQEIYDRPANTFVATFVGTPAINLLAVDVRDGALAAGEGFRAALTETQKAALRGRSRAMLGVRPEDVALLRSPGAGGGVSGRITLVESLGAEDVILLDASGVELRASVSPLEEYRVGETVKAVLVPETFKLFDPLTGSALH